MLFRSGPGRKALIPSICKYLNLRHTGSDSYRVCLCRDKFAIASILEANNIKVPKFQLYKGNNDLSLSEKTKYIAKPLYESSSIGISKNNIFYGNNIPYTYLNTLIKNLKQPLLIQEFISGYEIEVPILAGKQSLYAFSPVVLHKNNNSLIIGSGHHRQDSRCDHLSDFRRPGCRRRIYLHPWPRHIRRRRPASYPR